jgi:hypothetical protein
MRRRRSPRFFPVSESDLKIEEHYTDTAGFTDHVCPLSPAWFSQATPYGIAEADGSLTCDKGNGGRLPPGFRCHSGFAVQLYAGIEDVASRKSWRNH